MIIVTYSLYFSVCRAFVLFCCLAAGDDPGSQEVSDQEQMEYIETWMETRRGKPDDFPQTVDKVPALPGFSIVYTVFLV